MVEVSKLLEWLRIDSSLTIRSIKIVCKVCNYELNCVLNVTCKTGINIIINTMLCNNL